jgi:hypothetical protein
MYPITNLLCKRAEMTRQERIDSKEHQDYWLGDIFFTGGYGWGVDSESRTICLGREENILPVLKGENPIPEDYPVKQRRVLAQILEDMEVRYAGTTETRRSHSVRSRPIGVIRHRQRHAGRPKARKGFPIR